MTPALAHLREELLELERKGIRRSAAPAPLAPDAVSYCSNDYLGLAATPPPQAPAGAGASRLIAGERAEHQRAEAAFASWLGAEAALLFTSGYAANLGTVAALAGPNDLIVSDALNHASLIDGARLSRARVAIVPHGDARAIASTLASRKEERAWVVVESYYSMDADGPDLRELRALCDAHRAGLVVDEAHALGVLGPGGRGRCAEQGVRPDVLVGTLGKAFGGQGAFVAGPAVLRDWLWNRARSFVFSTGLAPSAAAAATSALGHVIEHPEIGARVIDLSRRLRDGLRAVTNGRATVLGFGHIVPVVVGANEAALGLASLLRERGIVVPAIRPPTVPEGAARVRVTVTARHQASDIDRAVEAVACALDRLGASLESR